MNATKHTPGLLTADGPTIRDANGTAIAEATRNGRLLAQQRADAAELVRRWNTWQAMRDGLRELVDAVGQMPVDMDRPGWGLVVASLCTAREGLRAALANSEPEAAQ